MDELAFVNELVIGASQSELMRKINYPAGVTIMQRDWYYLLGFVIGKSRQTQEMVATAVREYDGDSPLLKVISRKLFTKELCVELVCRNGNNLRFVTKAFLDYDLCLAAVSSRGLALADVPDEYKDYKLCLKAVMNDKTGLAIEYVPKVFMRGESGSVLRRAAVSKSGLSLRSMPMNYRTKSLCEIAVSQDGRALEYVPQKFLSSELYQRAVLSYPESLRSVPLEYVTKDLCFAVVKQDASNLQYVPDEFMSAELVDIALAANIEAIRFVPDFLKSKELCIDVAERNRLTPWGELFGKRFVEFGGQWFDESCFWCLCDDARTELELKYILVKDDSEKVIQSAEERSSLCSAGRFVVHDLVTSYDVSEDRIETIYYISDIHLEHQLPLKGKPYSVIRRLIASKVDELISSVQVNIPAKLLIAGDVADDIVLAALFYDVLRNRWGDNGDIFAVCGNHDLWCSRHDDSLTLDDIITGYCGSVGDRIFSPFVLENELIIKYKGRHGYVRLNESDVLAADSKELESVFADSTFILLGGTGFSGLNPVYNAVSGLYRGRLSSDEDAGRSRRFCAMYDKVLQCAGNLPVIVLTHNPMRDWSNGRYNSNWIYVHGHTHRNECLIDEKIAIFADNQIGYEPKKWCLKGFTLERHQYQPFRDWPDGVYQITHEQYSDFVWHRRNSLKYDGDVYLLKRDGTYMFVLQTKRSLCLLSGGRRKKLDKSIDYYFENLSLYAQKVRTAFLPYRNALERVSSEVKAFGGDGRIHGCIVDIDFWSHIYLNPFDGTLSAYVASSMIDKWFYSDVGALLQAEVLSLSDSYQKNLEDEAAFDELSEWNNMLKKYCELVSDGLVPILSQNVLPQAVVSPVVLPKYVDDMSMYGPSRIVHSVQYLFDSDVVRIWNDDVLNDAVLNKGLLMLPFSDD